MNARLRGSTPPDRDDPRDRRAPWPTVDAVVSEHAAEAAHLRRTRTVLVRAPHVGLDALLRHDKRIAAHVDGLCVAGEAGRRIAMAALDADRSAGAIFVAVVLAIDARDGAGLEELVALAGSSPGLARGVVSAFGWVSADALRGIVIGLLIAKDPWARELGLAACAMHGVDPGSALDRLLADDAVATRRRALRCVGELGRRDRVGACMAALEDDDEGCRFAAARAAVVLGERGDALRELERLALVDGDHRRDAIAWCAQVLEGSDAARFLAALTRADPSRRLVIGAVGLLGDPRHVPPLVAAMRDDVHARLAGESFGLLTGIDLERRALVRAAPDAEEPVPDEDDLAVSDDRDLPWPDAAAVAAWWDTHGARFAEGRRHFMGAPPTSGHGVEVLRHGTQRQRLAASRHLALLSAGVRCFDCAAPAHRQARLLARMA